MQCVNAQLLYVDKIKCDVHFQCRAKRQSYTQAVLTSNIVIIILFAL